MASHVRGDLWVATLILATGPTTSWSMVPSWSHLQPWSPLSDNPYLAQPPTSNLASDGPRWLLGTLSSPPSLEVLKGGYGFSETPPRTLSLVFTQGKGCVWQKQLYKCGCGDRSSRVTWTVC